MGGRSRRARNNPVFLVFLGLLGCSERQPIESLGQSTQALSPTTERTFGFESLQDWSPLWSSPTLTLSEMHSEGQNALALSGGGWMQVVSRKLSKEAPPPDLVGYDIRVVANPVNPWWYGATELLIDAPSVGIWGHYLGHAELTGLPKGQFHRVEFSLPAAVKAKLSGPYADLTFRVVVNVPGSESQPYLLDRFTFGPVSGCVPTSDGNPCTQDVCEAGQPAHPPLPAGTACANATVCDGNEVCNGSGTCVAGTPPHVDDGNPCTTDACDPVAGAVHLPLAQGVSCDDANACNGVDRCDGSGLCLPGLPPIVDDGNPCTQDACNPQGGLTHVPSPAGQACADGDVCNGAEACDGLGTCAAGLPLPIPAATACVSYACDPVVGVVATTAAIGTACDDQTVCNGRESCNGTGQCVAGAPPQIPPSTACASYSCDPITGVVLAVAPFGTACPNASLCDGAEACDGSGSCVAGPPPLVPPSTVCASYSCDPVAGVVATPASLNTPCLDGDACNGAEACDGQGACVGGAPPTIPSNTACTAYACSPSQGVVANHFASGTACNNTTVCDGTETCDGQGTCLAGTPLSVDDGNPCTQDSCDPIAGVTHQAAADGTSCADESACNGHEACATGACRPGAPPTVDDGNPCTVDTCDDQAGVVHSPAADGTSCSDGNACTLGDTCQAGACAAGSTTACPAPGVCQEAGVCDPATGACSAPTAKANGASCDDATVCNGHETCQTGACTAGAPPSVDDGNACTTDSCDPASGPLHTLISLPDDGDFETTADCDPFTGVVTHVRPPAPSDLVAPAFTAPGASTFADMTRFLYDGSTAVQGPLPGVPLDIEPARGGWMIGDVKDEQGSPLADVRVTVPGHPEVGQTYTRENGRFDMVVNGGALLTFRFEKAGYLPVDRRVFVGWEESARVGDVTMLFYENSPATLVTLGAGAPIQVAVGDEESDDDGVRTPVLVVPAGTTANLTTPGSPVLNSLNLRFTEYTVGEDGPSRMPAPLPDSSGYTYAVEISADEAIAAGNAGVLFSSPVFLYVQNFLNDPTVGRLPPGSNVPIGYYDRDKRAWIASPHGTVLTITGVSGGLATIDSGATPLSISDSEKQQLANLVQAGVYSIGGSLWRVPVQHLSPQDLNFARLFGSCIGCPPTPPAITDDEPLSCESQAVGSIISCESQSLGERRELAGTPFTLTYQSSRSHLSSAASQLRFSGLADPVGNLNVSITIAGRTWRTSVDKGQGIDWTFDWDGLDAAGRPLVGTIMATVDMSWSGSYEYLVMVDEFGQLITNPVIVGQWHYERRYRPFSYSSRSTRPLVFSTPAAGFGSWSLGGWTLNENHFYDVKAKTIYRGDGKRSRVAPGVRVVKLVMGSNGGTGLALDGESATRPGTGLGNGSQQAMAVASNGDIYFVDSPRNRVGKIVAEPSTCVGSTTSNDHCIFTVLSGLSQPAGIAFAPDGSLVVSTIGDGKVWRAAPNGSGGYLAPVVIASGLLSPHDLASGPDGSIYVTERGNRLVKRISPNLEVSTFAGNGTPSGPTTIGNRATSLGIGLAEDIAVAPNGTVFIGGESFSHIYRVTGDGIYRGGWGTGNSLTEGVPIGSSALANVEGLAAGPDGSLYYLDWRNSATNATAIRHVDPWGIVRSLSLGTDSVATTDGAPALTRGPASARALAVEPDGSVLVATATSIYRLTDPVGQASEVCGSSATEHFIPASDEGYCFDGRGNHLRTVDLRTGQPRWSFDYNAIGQLISVTDAAGLVTTIDPVLAAPGVDGRYEITAPHGQKTNISFTNTNFNAYEISDALATLSLAPRRDGLLSGLVDARGTPFSFSFGADGRLLTDTSLLGTQTLTRSLIPNGYQVLRKTPLGRQTRYQVTKPGASTLQVRTNPDGTQESTQVFHDGSTVVTSAEGTTTTTRLEADPRFGLRLSYPASQTVALPTPAPASGALSLTTTELRTARSFSPATQKWQEVTTTTRGGQPTQIVRTYDANGQTIQTTSPAGRVTTRKLDAAGRIVHFQVGDLTPTDVTYEDGQLKTSAQGDRITNLDYIPAVEGGAPQDDAGFVKRITDALGNRTEFDRDLYGRTLKQWEAEGTAHEGLTEMDWDANGNLERVVPPGRPSHDLAYDAVNGLAAYAPPVVPNAPFPTTTYSTTADRDPFRVGYPDGRAMTHAYDSVSGKLSSMLTTSNEPSIPLGFAQYSYYATNDPPTGKAAGRISSITGPYGVNLAFQYYGFLTTRETWSGHISGSVDFEYNNLFLRKRERVTPPAGAASSWFFGYDADSLITCVSASSTSTCSPPAATDLYLLRSPQHGQVTDLTAGHVGEHVEYSDTRPDTGGADEDGPQNRAFGELRSQRVTYDGTVLMELTYDAPAKRRDALGRIRFKTESLPGIALPCAGQTVDYEYEYDARNRLENVYRCGVLHEFFGYDPNGNIVDYSAPGLEATTATYDDQDRLLTRTTPDGTTTYTYGANGELQTKTLDGEVTAYAYDARGNLITVHRPGGLPLITYLVDAQGRRVGKMVGTTITRRWLYRDTLKPVAELDASGNILARYVYGSRSSTPELVVRDGKTYRVISDQLGSPRMVVNIADPLDVPFRADYSSFGVVTAADGYAEESLDWLVFGFAGGIYDRDTGLVRFGARDYDPEVARWTSKDPIRFDGGDTNLYGYVAEDPVGKSDPEGTGPLCEQCMDRARDRENDCLDDCFKKWPICGGGDAAEYDYNACRFRCLTESRKNYTNCFASEECRSGR